MWIPLAVLAALSVFGGWINVPEAISESFLGGFGFLPMGEGLHHWLEPVMAGAHEIHAEHLGEISHLAPFGGGELFWALASTAVAAAVILITARLISGQKHVPAVDAAEPTGLGRVLYRKYYVDEAYDALIVRPLHAVSRFSWRFVDSVIIDGTVNVVGNLARAFGWVGSLFQTGQINTYAFILTIGVLAILGWVAF